MESLMMRFATACVGALMLLGCSGNGQRTADGLAGEKPDYRRGMYAYTDYCAECHDSGRGGAPILDDSLAWAERGAEFPNLLRNHSRRGWLRAPGKGGQIAPGERSVAQALSYMTQGGAE